MATARPLGFAVDFNCARQRAVIRWVENRLQPCRGGGIRENNFRQGLAVVARSYPRVQRQTSW